MIDKDKFFDYFNNDDNNALEVMDSPEKLRCYYETYNPWIKEIRNYRNRMRNNNCAAISTTITTSTTIATSSSKSTSIYPSTSNISFKTSTVYDNVTYSIYTDNYTEKINSTQTPYICDKTFGNLECSLGHLLNETIYSVEDVQKIFENMNNLLRLDSSLNSFSNISQVNKIIRNINLFLNEKYSDLDAIITKVITNSSVQIFSKTLDQTIAWNNGTDSERTEAASEILTLIQSTSFILNCYLSEENNSSDFISDNLYEKQFFNFSEKIFFEYNSSSISVPEISYFENIEEELRSCKKDSSLGAVIRKLNNYMNESLRENQRMNTELMAFSIRNTNKTHPLRDGQTVKIK